MGFILFCFVDTRQVNTWFHARQANVTTKLYPWPPIPWIQIQQLFFKCTVSIFFKETMYFMCSCGGQKRMCVLFYHPFPDSFKTGSFNKSGVQPFSQDSWPVCSWNQPLPAPDCQSQRHNYSCLVLNMGFKCRSSRLHSKRSTTLSHHLAWLDFVCFQQQ